MLSSKLARIPLVVAGVILVLVIGVHLSAGWILGRIIEDELDPGPGQGTYLVDTSVNLFSGSLRIAEFTVKRGGLEWLRLQDLDLHFSTLALLRGELRLGEVRASKLALRVERRADGRLVLPLPESDPAQPPSAEPLALVLKRLSLPRFDVTYVYPKGEELLLLRDVLLTDLDLLASNTPAKLSLAAEILGGRIKLKGEVHPRMLGFSAQVDLAGLALERLRKHLDGTPALAGKASFKGEIAFREQLLGIVGGLTLDDLDAGTPDAPATAKSVSVKLDSLALDPRSGKVRAVVSRLGLQGASWGKGDAAGGLGGAEFAGPLSLSGQGGEFDIRLSAAAKVGLSGVDVQLPGQGRVRAETIGMRAQGLEMQVRPRGGRLSVLQLRDLTLVKPGWQGADGQSLEAKSIDLERLTLSPDERIAAVGLRIAELKAAVADSSLVARTLSFAELSGSPRKALLLKSVRAQDLLLTPANLDGASLRLDQLKVAQGTRDEQQVVRVPAIVAQQLTWKAGAKEPVTTLASAEVRSLRFDGALSIEGLLLSSLQAELTRNAEGAWRVPVPRAPANESTAPVATDAKPLHWRIGGVSLAGHNRLRFVDQGVQPERKADVAIESASLGSLDSARPDQVSPLLAKVRLDKYSRLDLQGGLAPLAEKVTLALKGRLTGLDMPWVSPYARESLGHRLTAGQLEDVFELKLVGNNIDMSNKLRIKDLAVERATAKQGGSDKAPPLTTAMLVLENRDGVIELDIPIKGDISDPKFSVGTSLNKVITQAVAAGALLALQPYGTAVVVGGLLVKELSKVRFKSVTFDAGADGVSEEHRKYLAGLAGKLKERPKLNLRVCGWAGVADLKLVDPPKQLSKGQRVNLLALAQRRAGAVRQLLRQGGLGDKRLTGCRPSARLKAKSEVKLSL